MTTYWCEWAWLGGDEATPGVALEITGDRLASVTVVDRPPSGSTRLAGVTLPGLVDAHSHAFHRALRGRTHSGTGSFWTWREQMYALAGRLDPDRYHRLARATFAEMASAGITTVGEFHYLHHGPGGRPYDDPNAMGEAIVAGAAEAGVRLTLLDTCYRHGGIGDELDPIQQRFADPSVEAWAMRTADLEASLIGASMARVGAGAHSVRALTPADLGEVAVVAADRSWPLHAHVSEQPAENDACQVAYGRTPTGLLADAGALGPRFTAVHAIHLTDADRKLLAAGSVCACPTTERDLADGIVAAAVLVDAGALLCLGSDSNAVIDLFEEARGVELDERLATGDRGRHRAADLLRAATSGGAEALGWPDTGRLEPGARADFVTVGLDSVRLAGTPADQVVGSLVFVATASDVRCVVVGGEIVVRDGRHATIDVAAELVAALDALAP